MSDYNEYVIVNGTYKKTGTTVTYKGKKYTVGTDAFASVAAAVQAGQTGSSKPLAVLTKDLTSPTNATNIDSAASDAFAGVQKNDKNDIPYYESFKGVSSGTAKLNGAAADTTTLNGFSNVTVKGDQNAILNGGSQSMSYTHIDNGVTLSESVAVTSAAIGTAVVDNTTAATGNVSFGRINPEDGTADAVDFGVAKITADIIADITANTTKYHFLSDARASYATVTLEDATLATDVFGGKNTISGSEKSTEDAKGNKSDAIAFREIVASTGKMTINHSTVAATAAEDVEGFGTVTMTTSAGDVAVMNNFTGGNSNLSYSRKSTFYPEKASTYATSLSVSTSATGKFSARESGTTGSSITVGNITGYTTVELGGEVADATKLAAAVIDSSVSKTSRSYSVSGAMKRKDYSNEFYATENIKANTYTGVTGTVSASETDLFGAVNGYATVNMTNANVTAGMDSFARTASRSQSFSAFISPTAIEFDNEQGLNAGGIAGLTDWNDFRASSDVGSSKRIASGSLTYKANDAAASAIAGNVIGFKKVVLSETTPIVPAVGTIVTASNFNSLDNTESWSVRNAFSPDQKSTYAENRRITNTAVGTASVSAVDVNGTFFGYKDVTLDNHAKGKGNVLNGQNSSESYSASVTAVESSTGDIVVSGSLRFVSDQKIGGTFSAKDESYVDGAVGYKNVTMVGSYFDDVDADTVTNFNSYLTSQNISDTIRYNDTALNQDASWYIGANAFIVADHDDIISQSRKSVTKQIASGTFSATDIIDPTTNDSITAAARSGFVAGSTVNLDGFTSVDLVMHRAANADYDDFIGNLELEGGNTVTTENITINTRTDRVLETVDFDSVGSVNFKGFNSGNFTSVGYKDVTITTANYAAQVVNASAGNYVRTILNEDNAGDVISYAAETAGNFKFISIADDRTVNPLANAGYTINSLAGFSKIDLTIGESLPEANFVGYTITDLNGFTTEDVDGDLIDDHAIIYSGKTSVSNQANLLTITATNGVETLIISGSGFAGTNTFVGNIYNDIYDASQATAATTGSTAAVVGSFAEYTTNGLDLPVSQFSTAFTGANTDAQLTGNYFGSGEVSDFIAVTDGATLACDITRIDLFDNAAGAGVYANDTTIMDGFVVGLNATLDLSGSTWTTPGDAAAMALDFRNAGVDSITGSGNIQVGTAGLDAALKSALAAQNITVDKAITFIA